MDKPLNNIQRHLYRSWSLKSRPTPWLGLALLEYVQVGGGVGECKIKDV